MTEELPDHWKEDLETLRKEMPLTSKDLCRVLAISECDSAGYYATLVFEWMSERMPIY